MESMKSYPSKRTSLIAVLLVCFISVGYAAEEMRRVIMILPALPKAWNNGSVKGLKARGGLTVESLKWENGTVTELVLKATHDVKFQLRMNGKVEHLTLAQGERLNTQ